MRRKIIYTILLLGYVAMNLDTYQEAIKGATGLGEIAAVVMGITARPIVVILFIEYVFLRKFSIRKVVYIF